MVYEDAKLIVEMIEESNIAFQTNLDKGMNFFVYGLIGVFIFIMISCLYNIIKLRNKIRLSNRGKIILVQEK